MPLSVWLWHILKISNEFLQHLSYALITESLPTLRTKIIEFYFATMDFQQAWYDLLSQVKYYSMI